MSILTVPEFGPDQPDIVNSFSDTVYNVLPTTTNSYGPFPSHQPFSDALSARCQGGLTVADSNSNVRVFSGDATKLYRLASPGTSNADVSKVGGYTTSSVQNWSFTLLGQRCIATNFNDVPQGYLEGTSTLFSDLITSGMTSIRAKYAAVIKNWLFLANTYDATSGYQPQRTWWSAINDPTNFPIPGTQAAANALSDYQDVPGPHGAINGIAGNLGTADGAVLFERAVWRIVYTGLPDIFAFVPAEGARGLLTSGGLCQFGNKIGYPTEDGFYLFDGTSSRPIGKGKIDRFFYNDIQAGYLDRMSSCSDPSRGLMAWAYVGAGASNGIPNRLLIYSEAFDRWTATEASAIQIEYLLRGATFGKTLEQLDAFGTIDSLPFSLDSSAWSGNRSILAAFDSSHKYGYFDGANLAAKIDSSDFEPVRNAQSKVNRATPLIDSSTATLALASRDKLSNPVSYGSSVSQEYNGSCAVRGRGNYHRLRMQTAAGDSWNQYNGIDIDASAQVGGMGRR